MNKTRESDKSRIRKYAVVVLVCVLIFIAALVILNLWEKRQGTFVGKNTAGTTANITVDGEKYVLNKNIQTFLIMGLDKFESDIDDTSYDNDQQADMLLLLVLDDEQKTCNIIQINRDTMVKVGVLGVAGQRINTVTEQIALAHTYGNGREQSCLNTSEAVSGLLDGIKVDHYMSVTMDAVPVLNDLVGGIEVTVLDDFGDYDPTLIKGETVTLKGEQALHYVRGRIGVGDNSNLSRMARQREYMDAFFSKARQLLDGDDSFSVDVMTSLADYMISDCTVSKLQELSKKAGEYELGEIYAMEGEAVVGEEFMEFYPDEAALNSLIAKLFLCKGRRIKKCFHSDQNESIFFIYDGTSKPYICDILSLLQMSRQLPSAIFFPPSISIILSDAAAQRLRSWKTATAAPPEAVQSRISAISSGWPERSIWFAGSSSNIIFGCWAKVFARNTLWS